MENRIFIAYDERAISNPPEDCTMLDIGNLEELKEVCKSHNGGAIYSYIKTGVVYIDERLEWTYSLEHRNRNTH